MGGCVLDYFLAEISNFLQTPLVPWLLAVASCLPDTKIFSSNSSLECE